MYLNFPKRAYLAIFALLVMGILVTEYLIAQSIFLRNDPDKMSFAITFDIVILIPILFYFLIVRQFKISLLTVFVSFVWSLGIAYLILPIGFHTYLNWVWMVLPVLEIALVIWVIWKVKTIRVVYKNLSENRYDFYLNLRDAFTTVLGNSLFIKILTAEIATLRYGLLPFYGKIEALTHQKTYTTHRRSAYIALWCTLLLSSFAELFAFHFLLARFGKTVVLITDILSIYTIVLLIADLTCVLKRPVLIDSQCLILRFGVRWNTVVNISDISQIEMVKKIKVEKETIKMANFAEPNVLISLKTPITVHGFYGISKQASVIAILVDDSEKFIEEINKKIEI